eukprot:1444674-Prymnesium_polylepis.1
MPSCDARSPRRTIWYSRLPSSTARRAQAPQRARARPRGASPRPRPCGIYAFVLRASESPRPSGVGTELT